MRLKSRTWFLISLLLFAASFWMWRFAERRAKPPQGWSARSAPNPNSNSNLNSKPSLTRVGAGRRKTYRVSNTPQTARELLGSDHAILLRNALIDTSRPLNLDIPAGLRARGAPGSYIVQSDRPLNQGFYDELKRDGVQYVSYIPNNAALVEATADEAQALTNDPVFQAVVPYEPYYKLDASLLPAAVNQEPETSALSVTVFPGQQEAALAALTGLGAKLIGQDNTPFGPTLVVSVPPESLTAVAQLPLAQEVERYTPRRALNDLTRVQLGISPSPQINSSNYLGLSGKGVVVDLNDTGVDATHLDLADRIFGDKVDFDGHGTHVAGIIAGNGADSSTVLAPGSVPGSIIPGADFAGKATNASIFSQSLDLVLGPFVSDADLAQNASINLGPTNLISNNSWGYGGTTYDMHAATYDAATRDAQPALTGEQPLLFVVAASNNGGQADTITSPGTAKNVITVGASDSPRFITNEVDYNSADLNSTNGSPVFYGDTDNSNLVASFSSCGNVDVGIEGTYGRFKPDVVAPGVFIASCRSDQFVEPTNETLVTYYSFPTNFVQDGQTNYYQLFLPSDTSQIVIQVASNSLSPASFPTNMLILADLLPPPTTVVGSNLVTLSSQLAGTTPNWWYFGVTVPTNQAQPVSYDLNIYLYETNSEGNYFEVTSNLDNGLLPDYRFDSGTSMA